MTSARHDPTDLQHARRALRIVGILDRRQPPDHGNGRRVRCPLGALRHPKMDGLLTDPVLLMAPVHPARARMPAHVVVLAQAVGVHATHVAMWVHVPTGVRMVRPREVETTAQAVLRLAVATAARTARPHEVATTARTVQQREVETTVRTREAAAAARTSGKLDALPMDALLPVVQPHGRIGVIGSSSKADVLG